MSSTAIQLPTPSDTPQAVDEPSPTSYTHNSTTWTPVDGMTPISTAPSRKRSIDETAFEAEGDGSYFSTQQVNTPATIPEEPIYGEGMVLLNPSTGMSVGADSQTGTWYEEKAEEEALKQEVAAANFRPKLPTSRKSMRLSQSSIKADLDAIATNTASSLMSTPASPPKTASSSHPEIDEATLALGIGWTRTSSEDEYLQTAARGWARYLDNHYTQHIHGAEILLKSSGLNAYLVGCQEGFYLFGEDLLEGKLVSRTWPGCLQNLRCQPIVFDGDEIIRAEKTPGPETKGVGQQQSERLENWADWDRMSHTRLQSETLNGLSAQNGSGMDLD